MTRLVQYFPRDSWLVRLLDGWRLGSPYGLPVADVMPGKHGEYSVMLWRPDRA